MSSCAAGAQQIVETRELPQAGGAPTIVAVRDLGGVDVPVVGELRPANQPDGVAVIGEALWITGRSFGRQPTVAIAGRPAAVLSRTGDGGILVRVPPGATSGPATVTVRQEHGSAEAPVTIRRYAAALAGGRVTWLDLSGETPIVVGGNSVPSARFVRISPDGRAAYLAGGAAIEVFDLPAQREPRAAGSVALAGSGRVLGLSVASSAQRLAILREADLALVDIGHPARPFLAETRPWPPLVHAGRVVHGELSPNGRFLAVALADNNRIAVLDLAHLTAGDAAVVADVPLDRDARAPVITDLAFAHDGRTVWALAGDTAESRALGPQTTRVFALRFDESAAAKLELARTVAVEEAVEPASLSTGRSLPLSSGAAVRLPPEKATVYFTAGVRGAARAAAFSVGVQDRATEIAAAPAGAHLFGLDVTPEGRWLLAAAVSTGGLAVLTAPADGRAGAVGTVTVGGGASSERAEVRIQP